MRDAGKCQQCKARLASLRLSVDGGQAGGLPPFRMLLCMACVSGVLAGVSAYTVEIFRKVAAGEAESN